MDCLAAVLICASLVIGLLIVLNPSRTNRFLASIREAFEQSDG
jgi:hypothetical protein